MTQVDKEWLMGSVHSINTKIELERFFEFMYGDQQGYAYSPTKEPESNLFEQYFFEWPEEKELLVEHCIRQSKFQEVYYGPALYTGRNAEKESFKSTSCVWVEFDGGTLPTLNNGLSEPALKLQSSTADHQHWYWRLDRFETDKDRLEDTTQRLAYYLQADLSCWNANRVLRPPGTTHHESHLAVSVLRWDTHQVPIESFSHLPELPVKLLHEDDIKTVPAVLEVIMKYPWPDEDIKFFLTKEIPKGQRSSALTKIGHICMEIGMTNAETLSILLNADSRWGKFAKRRDQKSRLLGIINYCRNRHPKETKARPLLKVYNYEEFRNTEVRLEWVVPGLIHKEGILCISGPPDVGKSQVSIRFAERLARGESFLKWSATRPIRTLFVSMEMSHAELKYITDVMQFPENEHLKENFLILPIGSSIRLNNKNSQAELNKIVEQFQPDGIMLDSLGVAISDDINSEKIVFETFDYVRRTLCGEYGMYTWFIHHHRKGQIGNKKPTSLDDLFGSRYIGAALSTAICLWPTGGPEIEILNLKLRMSEKFSPFKIKRTPGIDFALVENKFNSSTPILGHGKSTNDFDLSDTI